MKPYSSVKEIAEHLGCSKKVVYGMIERGELAAVRIGKKELPVSAQALAAWEAEQHRLRQECPARHA